MPERTHPRICDTENNARGLRPALPAQGKCRRLAWFLGALVSVVLTSARAQDVTPRQEAQIEGTVRDSAGNPVAGASVLLVADDHSLSAEKKMETRADGGFLFLAVRAGTYGVKVEKSGFRDATENFIELAPGEKTRCDLVLRAPGEFSAVSPSSSYASAESSAIQLDDRPNFVVAGVTDSTGSGGHGSETRMRTGEALAKETLKLKAGESKGAAAAGANTTTFNLAQALRASGKPAQARVQVNQILMNERKLDPQDEARMRRLLGDLDEQLEDPLGAAREYERAVGLRPSEPNYFAWGSELLLHKATGPAIEVFGRGARLHPDSARMRAGLGAALFTSGSAGEAAQSLCAASDLAPADLAPYLFLGEMQEASSTPLSCVEQALARFAHDQPTNARANYFYAMALWKRDRVSVNPDVQHDAQRVEALLQKSVGIDPKLDLAYLQLGNLYFARGDFPEALTAYEQAVAANPVRPDSHYRLGLTYKRIGQGAQAQVEFDKYKQLDKTETAAIERQRRELRQFLFVLKDTNLRDQNLKDQN